MSTHITALHGFLGQPSDFAGLAVQFGKMGVSFQALDLNSIEVELETIPAYLASQRPVGFSQYVLLGYSMGGRLALEAFRTQVQTKSSGWDKFIFVSVNPGLKTESEKSMRLESDLQWADKIVTLPWEKFLKEWNNQEALSSSREPQRLEQNYNKESLVRQLQKWSLARQMDSSILLEQANFPVLWISGSLDKKFSAISDNLKGPCLQKSVVPNSGHRVIFDNSEGLFYSINQWL